MSDKLMTFKEFNEWCNQRACDGCWGPIVAITCTSIISDYYKTSFWKRKKKWAELNKDNWIENEIVNPINRKIEETLKEKINDTAENAEVE